MHGLRQGVLNLLAVGLHQLLEQQQVFFFQRELAKKEKERFGPTTLKERLLAEYGIDSTSFGCAAKVYELRVAANAIKHGPGSSARTLAELRPDLFENPILVRFGLKKDD